LRGVPKSLRFWYPGRVLGDTENLAAIFEGDAHITRDLGTGIPETRGYPNHCDSAILFSSIPVRWDHVSSGHLLEVKKTIEKFKMSAQNWLLRRGEVVAYRERFYFTINSDFH